MDEFDNLKSATEKPYDPFESAIESNDAIENDPLSSGTEKHINESTNKVMTPSNFADIEDSNFKVNAAAHGIFFRRGGKIYVYDDFFRLTLKINIPKAYGPFRKQEMKYFLDSKLTENDFNISNNELIMEIRRVISRGKKFSFEESYGERHKPIRLLSYLCVYRNSSRENSEMNINLGPLLGDRDMDCKIYNVRWIRIF